MRAFRSDIGGDDYRYGRAISWSSNYRQLSTKAN